jgi:GTP pyrophosphokinase
VVDLQWQLKETVLTKPQHLFVEEATRNRILMMLSVAPDKMKVADIIMLSQIDAKKPAWEINFEVANLQGLQSILHHFDKSGLPYEFFVEQ